MKASAPSRDLHVQPGVAAIVAGLALAALGLSWWGIGMGWGNPLTLSDLVFAVCLVIATVAAYQFPLPIGRYTKVYLSSIPYYLLAALVAPPLAGTAAGVTCLLGELWVQKRRGTMLTDIVAQAGRRTIIVLLAATVAHLSDHGVTHTVLLLAAALIMAIGDIVTFPIIIGRIAAQPPLRIMVNTARQTYLVEGVQYLLGVLGALAWAHEFWALALLAPPTALLYMAFFANVQAQEARRAAQESADALRESEERYRTLFENASDIVYTHDLSGRLISINHAAERILGYTAEDLANREIGDIVASDQLERAQDVLQGMLDDDGTVTREFDVLTKDGGRITLEASSWPIYRGGKAAGIQGIARDLTDRRRMEEERTQHARELAVRVLQAQEEERKRISRELHDETAQSLSVLLAHLDLLENYIPEDGLQLRSGLGRIGDLAKRALDETRALSHDLRPTILDDVGLCAALQWLAREYERSFGGGVKVHADTGAGEMLSMEDEVALFRIAQEALSNCGKHAAARAVQVSLSLTDSAAQLVVQDNGRGFNPLDAPRPSREGHLGLYGMRERAALLGGKLEITSEPGRGTRVEAEVPLTAGKNAEDADRQPAIATLEAANRP